MEGKEEKMMVTIQGVTPDIRDAAFVAPNSTLVGDVVLGRDASVWYGAVLRADMAPIRIGAKSNVQDNAVLHADANAPCVVGNGVTVGHAAILHSCTVGDGCVVGMGAAVLNGAVIGRESIIGAGAVVTKSAIIPAGSLVLGAPAKARRALSSEERARLLEDAQIYVSLSTENQAGLAEG